MKVRAEGQGIVDKSTAGEGSGDAVQSNSKTTHGATEQEKPMTVETVEQQIVASIYPSTLSIRL